MTAIPEEDWLFLPLPRALAGPASGFVQVYSGRWWLVCPRRGLRFYNPVHRHGRRNGRGLGSPQCNTSRQIMERAPRRGDNLLYIERVFVPIDLADWRD